MAKRLPQNSLLTGTHEDNASGNLRVTRTFFWEGSTGPVHRTTGLVILRGLSPTRRRQ